MEQRLSDIEYSDADATAEQVEAAIRAAKVLLLRPLPLTHALPAIALVGYREKATGRNKLLREVRVFQTKELFASLTPADGHVRLFALPHLTQDELWTAQAADLPDYRVYETTAESNDER